MKRETCKNMFGSRHQYLVSLARALEKSSSNEALFSELYWRSWRLALSKGHQTMIPGIAARMVEASPRAPQHYFWSPNTPRQSPLGPMTSSPMSTGNSPPSCILSNLMLRQDNFALKKTIGDMSLQSSKAKAEIIRLRQENAELLRLLSAQHFRAAIAQAGCSR